MEDQLFIRFRALFYQHLLGEEIRLFLMAHGAFPRSVRPLLDVVRIGIPVVGHGIEVCLGNPELLEGIPHGWHQPEGSNFLGIPWILT